MDKIYFEEILKEAEAGGPDAQYVIGKLYDCGQGVEQDYIKAKEWYKRACDNGLQIACVKYKYLIEQGY